MASKQISENAEGYKISDYTTNLLTGSDTPGSIVKGASMLTGYKTGINPIYRDKMVGIRNNARNREYYWRSS